MEDSEYNETMFFKFYRSWYDLGGEMDDHEARIFYEALMAYMFDGEADIQDAPTASACAFMAAKPTLDAQARKINRQRWEQ